MSFVLGSYVSIYLRELPHMLFPIILLIHITKVTMGTISMKARGYSVLIKSDVRDRQCHPNELYTWHMELPVTNWIIIVRPVCLWQRGSGLEILFIYGYDTKRGSHVIPSWHGKAFCIADLLERESIGHRLFPSQMSSNVGMGYFLCCLKSFWPNSANNDNLGHHHVDMA